MTELLTFKILVPLLLITVSVLFALHLSSFFNLRIDLTKAFDVTSHPEPALRVPIAGAAGDRAWVNLNFPDEEARSFEVAIMSRSSSEEIRNQLNAVELEKWDFLSRLPSALIKFNVYVYSDPVSPNNGKLGQTFKVKRPNSKDVVLVAGESVLVASNFKFNELLDVIKDIELHLESPMMSTTFEDNKGRIVPQTTGSLYIRASLVSQLYILMASLGVVIALFSAVKTLLLSAKDVRELISHFSS